MNHVPASPRVSAWIGCALISGLILSGCVTKKPDESTLDPALSGQIPDHWSAARIRVPEESATGWLDDFDTDVLMNLAREAVGQNYDLASTAARVKSAAARARIAGADRLPQLDWDLDVSRSQGLRGASFQSVRANNFGQGFDLAWEIDLWGRIGNLRKSALRELDAADADYQASRLSLAATVARTALDQVESQLQVELSRQTLASLRINLEILDAKLEAGDADDRTALDISLSRADVARARSTIAQGQREADASRRLLETLLGKYPAGTMTALTDLPSVTRDVPAGLPSDLLLRRPDIIAAERRVDARLEDVAAARKALLPTIRITGSTGLSTTDEFAQIFDIRNLVWGIANNLAQPIFQGGRLVAEIDLTKAHREEIAADYAETALTAFREVETALSAEKFFARQQTALEEAVVEANRAEELSLSQYENAQIEIITLLESQRTAFNSRSTLLNVRLLRLQNRIDLYLALGGDFDTEPVVEEIGGRAAVPAEDSPAGDSSAEADPKPGEDD